MKEVKSIGTWVMLAVVAMLGAGCAGSYQARSVDLKESVLVNPSILKEGTGDQALYRYVKPGVDVKQYTKVMIDPVVVRKDGQLDADEMKDYQTLANNAFVYLNKELEKDYRIVMSPEPGTLRFQMAITDADTSKPVRNALSSIMPIGIGLSVIKFAATGKQSGVGEITVEMKVTDAVSGELLGAALDRRVGGKAAQGIWDTWYNANAALEYWAKQVAYVLCGMRGGANCVKP